MATAELGRKVRQLDNDVQEIYTMLADISATQKRHGNRLDEIDSKLETLTSGQTVLKRNQEEQATKLDQILALLQQRS